jgi:cellulose synthase/poly-beta-1,6-N-acetylglucosamine synthase-like glycosyltransferase
MTGLSLILQIFLAGVLCVIAALSVQLIVLGYIRLYRAAPRVRMPLLPDEALPRVLVQLPVCDEGPLAVRVAAAAARLDWPLDKLEIQVLDDGRAGDPDDLARAIMSVVPRELNLNVLRRGERSGFKAGNLAFGLKHSDAPFVAIFDADFVPPTDFLRRTVPALIADSGLAYVQARWKHANRGSTPFLCADGTANIGGSFPARCHCAMLRATSPFGLDRTPMSPSNANTPRNAVASSRASARPGPTPSARVF